METKAIKEMYCNMGISEQIYDFSENILKGLKERFEIHHGVRIHDNAIVAAAKLSDRYIQDRFLPDKAID